MATFPTVSTIVCTSCDATPPKLVVSSDRYPLPQPPPGMVDDSPAGAFQAHCWCQGCKRTWAQTFAPS